MGRGIWLSHYLYDPEVNVTSQDQPILFGQDIQTVPNLALFGLFDAILYTSVSPDR